MAVRVLQYVLSFYQDLLKQKKLKHLPPVFPIVLYSGNRKWTAPLNLEELIQTPLDTVKPYIPRFRYYRIACVQRRLARSTGSESRRGKSQPPVAGWQVGGKPIT